VTAPSDPQSQEQRVTRILLTYCRLSASDSVKLSRVDSFNTSDLPQSPAKLFYLFSIWSMLREALVSADGHHIQNYGGGLGKRSAALVAVNGGAVNIQDHATANARP
jgi:hypothetical protein